MNFYKKRTVQLLPFLFYLFLAVPLIYLPDLLNTSRSLRYIALLAIPAIALSIYGLRQHVLSNVRKSPAIKNYLVLALLIFILLSGLIQFLQHHVMILGMEPDYLGLLSWLAFLAAGLVFQTEVRNLILSKLSLYILGIAMLVSIAFNTFYIRIGVRVPGVMFQPTTLAMYANVAVIVALYNTQTAVRWQRVTPWLVFVLSVLVIGLCQSRIGNIMLTTSLIVWSYNALKKKTFKLPLLLLALTVAIISIPFVFTNYFSRLRSESVSNGISYRLDLYKASAKDILNHDIVKGNGPGTLPTAINNPDAVPEDIAQTLHFGFKFSSTHDLFLDFTYYFGLLAALTLLIFTIWSIIQSLKIKEEYAFAYLLIFLTLLLNALFNVPSLELTSLFFVVLFGLTGTQVANKLKQRPVKNSP